MHHIDHYHSFHSIRFLLILLFFGLGRLCWRGIQKWCVHRLSSWSAGCLCSSLRLSFSWAATRTWTLDHRPALPDATWPAPVFLSTPTFRYHTSSSTNKPRPSFHRGCLVQWFYLHQCGESFPCYDAKHRHCRWPRSSWSTSSSWLPYSSPNGIIICSIVCCANPYLVASSLSSSSSTASLFTCLSTSLNIGLFLLSICNLRHFHVFLHWA